MKIGLCWTGNPGHRNNYNRSIPTADLGPLLTVDDCEWVSVCREGWTADMAPILPNALEGCRDWYDTAHVLGTLDLVITVDTAIAHIAGGMGVPTWLLLHVVPDFRWGITGDSTPWYKPVRIFRQRKAEEWGSVIESVRCALVTEVQARRLAAA